MRRWLPYGAIALGVHVAATLLLRSPVRRVAPPALPSVVSEIDVESLAPPPPAPSPVSPMEASPSARLAMAEVPRAGHASGAAPPSMGDAVLRSSEPATPAGAWTFDPGRPVDLLTRGVPLASRETAPDAPSATSACGGLVEGLDARDAAMSMARGGPVLSVLEASASSEGAAEGTATFDVTTDSRGAISVALLSASTGSSAWARVGQATGASLDPNRLRIPPGAKGWRVVATVEAKVQYPNGIDPKTLGTHMEAAGPDIIENKHRASVGDSPLVFKAPPGVAVVHSGKVCTVRVGLGLGAPISGGCDLTNVGAVATRVVRSHIVTEGRL